MLIKEMIDKRNELIVEARTVHEGIEKRCKTDGADSAAGDREKFDKLIAESNKLKDEIAVLESDENRSKILADLESADESRGAGPRANPEPKPTPAPGHTPTGEVEERFMEISAGCSGMKHKIPMSEPNSKPEYRSQFRQALGVRGEYRALQQDSDPGGGYLAPQQFQAGLIQDLDDLTFMRTLGTVLPPLLTGGSIGMASLDADPADPTWTAEIASGALDTTMAFGKRELTPHPLAQRIKVSKKLIRAAAMSVDTIVRERLAYKTSIVQENAYLNGTGANEPLGLFTANANGITTSQDVSTGNTDSAITFDGLRNAKYDMPKQWRSRASWLFHRDGISQLVGIKDGDGRPMWQPSILASEPDRLMGNPVFESEFAPNTFTTGLYVGILGDFSFYHIIDALNMTIEVALELYQETNQNGYFARSESDAMPVLATAFRRVTLA